MLRSMRRSGLILAAVSKLVAQPLKDTRRYDAAPQDYFIRVSPVFSQSMFCVPRLRKTRAVDSGYFVNMRGGGSLGDFDKENSPSSKPPIKDLPVLEIK
jgi:hypothetical protein